MKLEHSFTGFAQASHHKKVPSSIKKHTAQRLDMSTKQQHSTKRRSATTTPSSAKRNKRIKPAPKASSEPEVLPIAHFNDVATNSSSNKVVLLRLPRHICIDTLDNVSWDSLFNIQGQEYSIQLDTVTASSSSPSLLTAASAGNDVGELDNGDSPSIPLVTSKSSLAPRVYRLLSAGTGSGKETTAVTRADGESLTRFRPAYPRMEQPQGMKRRWMPPGGAGTPSVQCQRLLRTTSVVVKQEEEQFFQRQEVPVFHHKTEEHVEYERDGTSGSKREAEETSSTAKNRSRQRDTDTINYGDEATEPKHAREKKKHKKAKKPKKEKKEKKKKKEYN